MALMLNGEPVHECRSLVLVLLVCLWRNHIPGWGVGRVGCHGKQPLVFDEGIENHSWEMGNLDTDRVEGLVPHCKKAHKIMGD